MLFLCSNFSPSPRGKGRIAGQVGLDIVAQFASTLGPFIQIPYRELLVEMSPALASRSLTSNSCLSSESPIVGVTFQPSIIIFVTPHNILFLARSA